MIPVRPASVLALTLLAAAPASVLAQQPSDLSDQGGKPAEVSKPVQVFLIMGQSNTLEMGKVKGPEGSLEHAVKEEELYPFMVDDAGAWSKRDDVRNVHVMGSARDGHVVSTACDAHCTRPGAPRPRVSALVLAPHPRARRGRLKDGLRRAHSNWDRPDGGRVLWLTSCRDSECVNELAQLLISLEATVRAHITLILCFPRGHGALRGTPRPATLGVQAATQDLGCNPVCPSLRPECAQSGEHMRAGARAAEGRGHQRAAAVADREHGARVHGRVRAPLL